MKLKEKISNTIEQHWVAYVVVWFSLGVLAGNYIAQNF